MLFQGTPAPFLLWLLLRLLRLRVLYNGASGRAGHNGHGVRLGVEHPLVQWEKRVVSKEQIKVLERLGQEKAGTV
jgi:hypothetical protein